MEVIRGIIDESLNGKVTLRGFASVEVLRKISIKDPSYQRIEDDEQVDKIKRFLENGKDLFFPEIILSLRLDKDEFSETGLLTSLVSIKKITTHQHIVISINKKTSTGTYPRLATLKVPPNAKLFRIDGNHRLTAFDVKEGQDLRVPFCIIFTSGPKLVASRSEKAFFHNLNTTSLPLKKEELLVGIIDDRVNFPDKDLDFEFGKSYLNIRLLADRLDLTMLGNLHKTLHYSKELKKVYTWFEQIFDSLNNDFEMEVLVEVIKELDQLYKKPPFLQSESLALLTAFLIIAYQEPNHKRLFEKWILNNHYHKIKTIKCHDLIELFKLSLESRKRSIFVSMSFDKKYDGNFRAIEAAVKAVNDSYPEAEIKLDPIRMDMRKTGSSYEINQEILKLIENSGLLIADLSGGNKNVYHEIGYLMGLDQGKELCENNFILIHNNINGSIPDDVGFNIASIQQLRVSGESEMTQKLKEQIEIFYGFKDATFNASMISVKD